jgi:hypothetical protein
MFTADLFSIAGGRRVVIQKWRLDRDNYIAVPVMSDGREGPPLELRPLFAR